MDEIVLLSSESSQPSSPSSESEFPKTKISELLKNVGPSKRAADHVISDSDDDVIFSEEIPGTQVAVLSQIEEEYCSVSDEPICKSLSPGLPLQVKSPPKKVPKKAKSKKTDEQLALEQAAKEEKRLIKEAKAKEKAERAEALNRIRRFRPGECVKYMIVGFDDAFAECDWYLSCVGTLDSHGIKTELSGQTLPFSVLWKRTKPDGDTDDEQHLMLVWPYQLLVDEIQQGSLIETLKTSTQKYPSYSVILVIRNLNSYLSKSKSAFNKQFRSQVTQGAKRKASSGEKLLSRNEIEYALTQLQIILKISFKNIKNADEFAQFVYQYTKAIAETPFKKEIEFRDKERSWFARGDSRDCVRVEKETLNGLSQLWLKQLCQFTMSSMDVAKTIAAVYPTPTSLFRAYEECSSQKEKDLLLQNLMIKRTNGAATRRLGPELSKKISLMFTQNDGERFLSQ